jgi:HD-GYP domain-containing protein (c-di-GMP phosphodiesterase class II)
MGKQSERRTVRYLPQVLLVTGLMLGAPVAVAWGLLASGAVTSLPLLIAIAVSAALLLGQLGAAIWKRRPHAGDLLFGELFVWGWLRRLWSERRLASAVRTMGVAAGAGEIDPAQQVDRLERLIAALESSDPYTHGHSQRVARYSATIASRLRLPAEQVARIRTAAAVHDVGKVNTPPAVLRKRGALTGEELEAIKRHPVDGARMGEALGDPELTRSVLHHHERLDGKGYPEGISGEDIPIGARIIAVVDAYDAMVSDRPYRDGLGHAVAEQSLREGAGSQWDPRVVEAFLTAITELEGELQAA